MGKGENAILVASVSLAPTITPHRHHFRPQGSHARFLTRNGLACLAATLVNPYTWRLYLTILDLPTQTGAYQWLTELHALGFRWLTDWIVLGLTCLSAYALGDRARLQVFEVALLVSGAWFAFRAQRDVWLVVLPALAIRTTRHDAPAELSPLRGRGRGGVRGARELISCFPFWSAALFRRFLFFFCWKATGKAAEKRRTPKISTNHVRALRAPSTVV